MTADEAGHEVGLAGTLDRGGGYFRNEQARPGLDVGLFGLVHHVAVGAALLGRKVHRFEVAVDDGERVALGQEQTESRRTVAHTATNELLAHDGPGREARHDVLADTHGVIIGRAAARCVRELLAHEIASGRGLLQADHVGPALRNIAADKIAPRGVGLLPAKIHDVVRKHLHAAAGSGRRQVQRYVRAHRQDATGHAHKRYPRPARCQQQTDEKHGHIGRQEKGKRQTDDAEETAPRGVQINTAGTGPQGKHGRPRRYRHYACQPRDPAAAGGLAPRLSGGCCGRARLFLHL